MTPLRCVCPEALDGLAADDPAARRSRRDLVRVHRAMGTRGLVARGWQALLPAPHAAAPLRVLELGAGDGTLLLNVARTLMPVWPQVQLTLLDRQDLVSPATHAGLAALGWQTQVLVTDVRDWAEASDHPRHPGAATTPRWDLITTTLFLHHFHGPTLRGLLRAVAERTERFYACEPQRGWLAWAASHLVGALGANAVTRGDAVLSVQAGFRSGELSALWPASGAGSAQDWALWEQAIGPFSHGFSAQRVRPRPPGPTCGDAACVDPACRAPTAAEPARDTLWVGERSGGERSGGEHPDGGLSGGEPAGGAT